jgi:hypothetical protein
MENQIELNGIVFRRCVSHYPTTYASKCGLIYDSVLDKILDEEIRFSHGYYQLGPKNMKGGISSCTVHRLVCFCWIENDRQGVAVQINHINLNKIDNRAENLEWVTQKENYIHYIVSKSRSKEDVVNDPWGFRKCIEMIDVLPELKNDKVIIRAMEKYRAMNELLGIGIEEGEKNK